MAQPSRTTWPDWATRPVICSECGGRVTLKQAHRSLWDSRSRSGRIWHSACDPWRVRVLVEAA